MCDIVSGVIQGSACGLVLYTVVADSLLCRLKLPAWAFSDYLKLLADVVVHSHDVIQQDVDAINQWSDERFMPLSIEKCAVMHCGKNQRLHSYVIKGKPLMCIDSFKDLGLVHTSNSSYSTHCEMTAARAYKTAGAVRQAFQLKAPQLLWPAFQSYVAPIARYCSQIWSPLLRQDVNAIEKVQRRYTKYLHGMSNLSYDDRLKQLGALSLEQRRQFVDLVFTYKALNGHINCAPEDIGLFRSSSACTRGGSAKLTQRRAILKITESLFCVRVPSAWNKLPANKISSTSLNTFKRLLLNYLVTKNN